jgi:hypothetical protein
MGVLAKCFLQLLKPLGEGLVVLRQRVELGQFRAQLLVVSDRVADQLPRLGVSSEDREKVLLLKAGMEF